MRSAFHRAAFLAALIASLFVGAAYAQDDVRPNSLEAGSWALLFQIDGITDLGFFEGMVAVKYHMTPRRAWRFGLGANAATGNDRANVQGGGSVQAQYLLYPWTDRDVNLYLGAGPRVGFNAQRIEEPDIRRTQLEIGLTGRLGVEWFATRSISLLGEYGNEFALRHEDRQDPNVDDTFLDFLYRTSVKLGIAAYF